MTRWAKGERTVAFLIDRGRLEPFEASDPATTASALVERATRQLDATARAALANGDADGAYAAAYDAYRMAGEALLARQLLRATGGDGSHMTVEDAVSAQFAAGIPAFAKPAFGQLLWNFTVLGEAATQLSSDRPAVHIRPRAKSSTP